MIKGATTTTTTTTMMMMMIVLESIRNRIDRIVSILVEREREREREREKERERERNLDPLFFIVAVILSHPIPSHGYHIDIGFTNTRPTSMQFIIVIIILFSSFSPYILLFVPFLKLRQTAMEAAHEVAQMLRTGSKILVVTGAGVEYDLHNLNPNLCHRLCAVVAATGGAHVTTNISGVQLLSQPNEQERKHISFVAVHGILHDQQKGRAGSRGCVWRRPRCKSDAHQQPLLQGRRITVPIPVGSVEDDDLNYVDARASAKRKTFLLIVGSSLAKPTNGRALCFLDAADNVERVIFVNIDSSRDSTAIAEALQGWGLPVRAQVTCVAMMGEAFADAVLNFAAEASQPAQLREVVERSKHWVQMEKVDEMRRLFPLPPKSELSVAKHAFGAAKVTVGEIYDLQKALASTTRQPAAGASP